ncbi:OPT oligopeptide transporter protein-domain-containing protein [Lipomyces mesembrius]
MQNDPISRVMVQYPEVPDWWYLCILLISLAFGIIAVQCWPTGTPSWSIIVIIIVCVVLVIPSAVIYSVSGYQLGFNDIGIILEEYMVPGHAIANIICRVYGWNVDAEAESFIGESGFHQEQCSDVRCWQHVGALNALIKSIPDLCGVEYCGHGSGLLLLT